jgi:hypothetical protein
MFFKTAIVIYKELRAQKKYINDIVEPYLNKLEVRHNGLFTKYQRFKITSSYCLYVPVIVCYSVSRLIGQPISQEQRKSATMMGLITPLYDDLLDELNLTPNQIEQLTTAPENYQSDVFLVNAVKEIGIDLNNSAFDKAAYLHVSKDVLQVQINTIEQFNPNISSDELQKITWDKAMISFVYYYTHLFGTPTKEMREALYKDCQGKSYTLANTCQDFSNLKTFFFEKNKELFQKVSALPYPKKDKEYFMIRMLLIICSGLVAINYMIKLEKIKGKPVNWFTLSRKELVIDMEKPKNLILWFLSLWKLMRLYQKTALQIQ